MQEEIWKDIKGYEGLYQVSNLGRIKSIRFTKEKILKFNIDRYGYSLVGLCVNNIYQKLQVHRLVAQAFIPNSENKPCVNHINELKNDNRAENLEWCSISYNNKYGKRLEKYSKKVNQYDLLGNFIRQWNNANEAGILLNIPPNNIRMCCVGNLKTSGKFKWKYLK